jgi:hypothetical protein
VKFLVDENMPRPLAAAISQLGYPVQDVRDIGLLGHPDPEVMETAIATDAIIITRDRGFADPRGWPDDFTAGVIFVNLPSSTPAPIVMGKVLDLIQNRRPNTILGAYTAIELSRSLSRPIRSR